MRKLLLGLFVAAITLAGVAIAQFAHRPRDPLPEGVTVVD